MGDPYKWLFVRRDGYVCDNNQDGTLDDCFQCDFLDEYGDPGQDGIPIALKDNIDTAGILTTRSRSAGERARPPASPAEGRVAG